MNGVLEIGICQRKAARSQMGETLKLKGDGNEAHGNINIRSRNLRRGPR